jgi:predicted enzyme related to lactoylglutathione lyase
VIEHIKTVAVYVEDQERALDFYTRILGFEVRNEVDLGARGRWLELAPPGAETSLVLYSRALMANWRELKPSLVFRCDDVRATCQQLAAKGVRITGPPTEMAWGTYAKFADPDGNEFLLTTPRPAGKGNQAP